MRASMKSLGGQDLLGNPRLGKGKTGKESGDEEEKGLTFLNIIIQR